MDDNNAPTGGPGPLGIQIATTLHTYSYESENPPWSSSSIRNYDQLDLNLAVDFHIPMCVRKSDLKQILLFPISGEGWGIRSVETAVCDVQSCYQLSQDLNVNYWVDSDGKNENQPLKLTLLYTIL